MRCLTAQRGFTLIAHSAAQTGVIFSRISGERISTPLRPDTARRRVTLLNVAAQLAPRPTPSAP